MKFLLDTNIVSELRKGERADRGLRHWFQEVDGAQLALSILVLGEIRLGILRLQRKDRRSAGHLSTWLLRVERAYRGRIFSVDRHVAEAWAELNQVRSLPVIDSLQAATALVHGLTFVTRNTEDLQGVAVPLLNPFKA